MALDCGSPDPRAPVVPEVVAEDLDDAKRALAQRGIDYDVEPLDAVPVVDELWEACDVDPAPGERSWSVTIYAADDCS